MSNIVGDRIRQFVDRIVRLEDEKAAIGDDIKDVYKEAKGVGLVPKILRKLVANQRKDREKVQEEKELLELYEAAMNERD